MSREKEPQIYLSILIPVYNEANKIRNTLQRITNYLNGKDISYEIIVVNDGSTDGSLEMVRGFFKEIDSPPHTILDYGQNRGKGFAIKKGMLVGRGKHVLFLDADLSGSIEEMEKFFPFFESEYDVLIGLRKLREVSASKKTLFTRGFLGAGFLLLGKLFLNLRVWDITCGFKCYQRNTVDLIFSKQLIDGWSFDAENLFLAKKYGFKVKTIPIHWTHYDRDSKVKIARDVLRSGWELIKIRINDLKGRYDRV